MGLFGSRRQPEPEPQPAPERPTRPPSPQPTIPPQPVPQQPIGFETVLGASSSLEGSFVSSSNVRLDGVFSGTLEINGNILVGETARITADINARNISIAGAVRGNVVGKKVQLLRTGRVWGDITATALTTEEGAFIDGRISMVGQDSARSEISGQPGILSETVAAAPEVTTHDDSHDTDTVADTLDEPEFLENTPDDPGETTY